MQLSGLLPESIHVKDGSEFNDFLGGGTLRQSQASAIQTGILDFGRR